MHNLMLGQENIVKLIEVCRDIKPVKDNRSPRPSIYLVFEFCDHDLSGVLKMGYRFTLGEKKSLVQQLLRGLAFMHWYNIWHRDLKTANILLTKNGVIKIADFGLSKVAAPRSADARKPGVYLAATARTLDECKHSGQYNGTTSLRQIVTLWYRAPELLLGYHKYGAAIDMWSCGCVITELWRHGEPLFKGGEYN